MRTGRGGRGRRRFPISAAENVTGLIVGAPLHFSQTGRWESRQSPAPRPGRSASASSSQKPYPGLTRDTRLGPYPTSLRARDGDTGSKSREVVASSSGIYHPLQPLVDVGPTNKTQGSRRCPSTKAQHRDRYKVYTFLLQAHTAP